MAPVSKNAVVGQYFSHAHPNHPLMHHPDDGEYTCHGCKTSGSGPRLRCQACPLDIHMYCVDCPSELSSFLHNHPLALVPPLKHRICDVCRESLDGMFYRCKDCGFDVHPLCTQLPQDVRHVIDDHHKLRLKKQLPRGTGSSCSVCKMDCSSLWVYGCDVCRLNIHPKCLLKPYGARRSEIPLAPSASRQISYAPPPWNNLGNGVFFGSSGYGRGRPPYPYVSPWGFPNYHFHYPPPPPQPIYYGSVPFPLNNPSPRPNYGGHTPPFPSPSIWGSMLGNTMFSLVENLAAGAVANFIFGSFN